MCERLKQAVLKTAVPARVPGVRIPLPPPCDLIWRMRSIAIWPHFAPHRHLERVAFAAPLVMTDQEHAAFRSTMERRKAALRFSASEVPGFLVGVVMPPLPICLAIVLVALVPRDMIAVGIMLPSRVVRRLARPPHIHLYLPARAAPGAQYRNEHRCTE